MSQLHFICTADWNRKQISAKNRWFVQMQPFFILFSIFKTKKICICARQTFRIIFYDDFTVLFRLITDKRFSVFGTFPNKRSFANAYGIFIHFDSNKFTFYRKFVTHSVFRASNVKTKIENFNGKVNDATNNKHTKK